MEAQLNMALEWRTEPHGRQGCDGIRPLKRQGIIGTRQGLLCEEQMKRSGNAVDSPSGNRGRFFYFYKDGQVCGTPYSCLVLRI